jgi:hypothetical protein
MSDKPKSVFEEMAEGTFAVTTPAAATPVAQQQKQAAKPVVHTVKAEPGATPAPAAQVPGYVPMDAFMKFVELLTAREAREEAKLQVELQGNQAREKQRNRNSANQGLKLIKKQARCRHRKGAKNDPRVDYNVGMHTLPTGEAYIKCLTCRMRWLEGDTAEFLYRGPKHSEIPNHTKKGWYEACQMVESSTNRPSMSEIPITSRTSGIGTRHAQIQHESEVDAAVRDSSGELAEAIQI